MAAIKANCFFTFKTMPLTVAAPLSKIQGSWCSYFQYISYWPWPTFTSPMFV